MSSILSTGYYLPPTIVQTEHMLAETRPERFGIAADYITNEVGVKTVRHTDKLPSELAAYAAEQAIEKTGVNPDHIDLIVFTGIEGDYVEPATAHIVQHRLGLKAPICFDVSNACLGFITGMKIASDMIAAGTCRYALICTGERPSQICKSVIDSLRLNKKLSIFRNKVGALTTGDAGGAVILGPAEEDSHIHGFFVKSESEYSDLCYYKRVNNHVHGQMIMGKIVAHGIRLHKEIYRKSLASIGWDQNKIDCLITHQVGKRLFDILSKSFLVATSKMTRTYDWLGNLTSATFPVNLGYALENGQIKTGTRIYAAMGGSGISVCHIGLTV